MKYRILILIICLHFCSCVYAQSKFNYTIGLNYNTMIWHINNPILASKEIIKYNQPIINLNGKLAYNIYLKKNIAVSHYIGLFTYGGNSQSDSTKFKDEYTFYSIEFGSLNTIMCYKKLALGFGIKTNCSLFSYYCSYGTTYQYDSLPRNWKSENIKYRFRRINFAFGGLLKYNFNKFSLLFEFWNSINNINSYDQSIVSIKTFDINYRVGFSLPISKHKK